MPSIAEMMSEILLLLSPRIGPILPLDTVLSSARSFVFPR